MQIKPERSASQHVPGIYVNRSET